MQKLQDKVAIITGGGSGNGRGIARKFASEGAKIVVADINEAGSKETLALLDGDDHFFVSTNVTSKTDVDNMVKQVLGKYGRIDILVNNAGIVAFTPFLELGEEEWDRVLDVNLKGPFFCSQAVAREMIRMKIHGSIINITSVEAMIVVSSSGHCQPHYNASKGGLEMLNKAMALELAAEKIRVNAIAPGVVETPFTEEGLKNPKAMAWIMERVPLKRVGQPQDIGNAACFLASDESDYITGTTIIIDGGWVIQ